MEENKQNQLVGHWQTDAPRAHDYIIITESEINLPNARGDFVNHKYTVKNGQIIIKEGQRNIIFKIDINDTLLVNFEEGE